MACGNTFLTWKQLPNMGRIPCGSALLPGASMRCYALPLADGEALQVRP